jgi:hypothetical protein
MVTEKKAATKLKVGSRVKTEVICGITGKPFIVRVMVTQANDTQLLLKWKGKKWYEALNDAGKQTVANEINSKGEGDMAEFNEEYIETPIEA